jgi:hypothetical protein
MFQLLYPLVQVLEPVLQPLCFLTAWIFIFFVAWTSWSASQDGIATVKRLHEIPCSNCQFFTGSYQLKCTVHPMVALSEEAINCFDYYPESDNTSY